ncbi:MAG: hypothetical protein ACT6FE_05910 [Methanosarcinaceae archaeon]
MRLFRVCLEMWDKLSICPNEDREQRVQDRSSMVLGSARKYATHKGVALLSGNRLLQKIYESNNSMVVIVLRLVAFDLHNSILTCLPDYIAS